MAKLDELERLLIQPASWQHCSAKVYCGEPGDVHTGHKWLLDEDQREYALAALKLARAAKDWDDAERQLEHQITMYYNIRKQKEAKLAIRAALAELNG